MTGQAGGRAAERARGVSSAVVESVRYRPPIEVEAQRTSDVRAAMRLDWLAMEKGAVPAGVVILAVFAVVDVVTENPMGGAVFAAIWGLMILTRTWTADAEEHGAELRRIVPLSRRSVVTGRYVLAGMIVAVAATVMAVAAILAGVLTGRGVTAALVSLAAVAGVVLLQLLVAIPVLIRYGRWAMVLVNGVLLIGSGLLVLGAGPLLLGFDPDVEMQRFAVSAVVTAWLLPLVAAPISYRIAQRTYASKDL